MQLQISDKEMIIAMKHGSVQAYESLFMRYYPAVLRFISGMLKNRNAEDICQSVFLKLWLHRESMDASLSVKSWLFTVAKNEIINYFKSKRNLTTSVCREVPEPADVEMSPDEVYSMEEMRRRINRGVEDMPSQRKLIFRLSRYNNLTNKQIAEFLNLSVRTVDKHIELALRDLRRSLN